MQNLVLGFFLVLISACGSKPSDSKDATTGSTPTKPKHVVMIVDEGFDVNLPIYKNKIKEYVRLVCEPMKIDKAYVEPKTYEEFKKESINDTLVGDSHCQIVEKPSSVLLSTQFSAIDGRVKEWNLGIQSQNLEKFTDAEFDQIENVITGEEGKFEYHGTSVASIVAYDNDVDLVLVETRDDPTEPVNETGDDKSADCPTQLQIDWMTKLNKDSDFIAATLAELEKSVVQKMLLNLFNKYKPTFVNMSFGASPYKIQDSNLKEMGCAPLELDDYRASEVSLSNIENDYFDKKIKNKPVFIQSAGNESAEINTVEDFSECGDVNKYEIMIGSHNLAGERSEFSNYGDCVMFNTLGEEMLAYVPHGFLYLQEGTSFSAPLAIRYLTKKFAAGTPPAEIIKAIPSLIDKNKNLKENLWPKAMTFPVSKQ